MDRLFDRMLRAARLDSSLFEEVEHDRGATDQAMVVVVISSVAAGIGGAIAGGFLGLIGSTVMALVGWYLWAVIVYFVGTRLLPEPQTKSDIGEVMRVVGFAAAPGVIRILGFLPLLGPLINLAAAIWMLLAMVVAVRRALDYSGTGRAVAVCMVGWVIYMVFFWVLGLLGLGSIALFT